MNSSPDFSSAFGACKAPLLAARRISKSSDFPTFRHFDFPTFDLQTYPTMNIRNTIPIFALAAVAAGPLHAQATDRLLSTVGTVVERDGHHYAYILWQPDEAATTFGKRFAIYSKTGDIPSAAPYARKGIQTLQTSPETIRAMLNLGDKVDFDPGAAAPQIAKVYQSVTLQLGQAPGTPADANLDASGRLAYMIAAATDHNEVLDQLFLLGRTHPGIMLALGHAFMIEVPATGVKTYELREIDGADHDVQVLGRVELDSAAPPVPHAPGPPVAVPHPVRMGQYVFSQKDDLNARLRWGAEDPLRRMLPYTFGFDVFRVKEADAVALNWNTTPPTRQALMQRLATQDPAAPVVVRPNGLPILPETLPDLVDAADPNDHETFFYADDNKSQGAPFHDGDSFYYFVAARTITGHPGKVSPGTLVQMCDRIPPRPPRIAAVENIFVKPLDPADWASQAGTQHLRVKIRQLPEGDPREAASGYYIYRWKSAKQYLVEGGDPLHNRVGYVSHVPGERFVNWDDNGPSAPKVADAGKTFWYTVRAADDIACTEKNLSAHSAPKYGVIRDRKGPDAPFGEIAVCRFVPVAEYTKHSYVDPGDYGSDGMRREFRVQVDRTSSLVASFDLVVIADRKRTIVSVNLPFRVGDARGITLPFDERRGYEIRVRGVSSTGVHGNWAEVTTDGEGGGRPPYSLPIYTFGISIDQQCVPSFDAPDDPPHHESVGPDGHVVPIQGWLSFDSEVHEWRIYRRVGRSGPLSLIAKGQTTEGSVVFQNPAHWLDPHMPSTPGTLVCYYGQVFDEEGNPSPLQRLECIFITGPALPVPLVESPALLEDLGNGKGRMKLSWFCDPAGVDRFELLVATGDGTPAGIECGSLSDQLSDTGIPDVTDMPAGLVFYPYQTTRLDGSMGAGPQFSVIMEIPLGKTLYFAVRAAGSGAYDNRPVGANSNVVSGIWSEPAPTGTEVIPWPARPLPDRYEIQRNVMDYGEGEGPFYAVKFPVEWSVAAGIFVGMFNGDPENEAEIGSPATLYAPTNDRKPEDYVFDMRVSNDDAGSTMEDLMPFMVYRYQLPSTLYPDAAPNIVQVTPLIDQLSWKDMGWSEKYNREEYVIRDPFFIFATDRSQIGVPVSGTFSREPDVALGLPASMSGAARPPYSAEYDCYMFVADRLPVVKGAKYQYIIVSFCERGEIRRVIPVNPVQQ